MAALGYARAVQLLSSQGLRDPHPNLQTTAKLHTVMCSVARTVQYLCPCKCKDPDVPIPSTHAPGSLRAAPCQLQVQV